MRDIVFDRLKAHAPLATLVGIRIYAVNMRDTKPDTPYVVCRIGTVLPRVVPAKTSSFQVWAHDNRGDYTTVDLILEEAKKALISDEGEGFYEIRWLEDSSDLFDDASTTITRYSRFEITQVISEAPPEEPEDPEG